MAKNTANTATRTAALEQTISYAEKVRLMVIEVLREETGRELAAKARFNGQTFDWEQHNADFRSDYADGSLEQLLAAARKFYGLKNLDAVKERRAAHKQQRAERIARAS